MSVFSQEVRVRCGVPDIAEIPPLSEITGCLIGSIPILAPHLPILPRDGFDGRDGKDGHDGSDGRDGCDGLNGTDGQDGADGRDGCNGINGADAQDGTDGADATFPFDQLIFDGCTVAAEQDGAVWVRVFPECDQENEVIDVLVPYPSVVHCFGNHDSLTTSGTPRHLIVTIVDQTVTRICETVSTLKTAVVSITRRIKTALGNGVCRTGSFARSLWIGAKPILWQTGRIALVVGVLYLFASAVLLTSCVIVAALGVNAYDRTRLLLTARNPSWSCHEPVLSMRC